MDETQKAKDEKEAPKASPEQREESQNPNIGKSTSIIEEANKAAERLERANAEQRMLLERNEEFIALQRLGGRTEGGQAPIPVKEESPQEYAKKILEGKIPLK
jgi:hypothetical protein